MKFSKKILTESLSQTKSDKKVFTEGKRQNVILSEEQLDRLLARLEETKQNSINTIIKECHQLIRESIKNEGLDLNSDDYSGTLMEQGQYDRNPGVAAAEGLENVLNGIKKAYEMIKDSDTRKKLANSITKLGNFMTITADAIASGRDQRAMANPDSLKDPLPYPELDTVTVDDEEISEEHDDIPKIAHLDVEEGEKIQESKEEKEKLIQEDIKKMKQIIKPISKI